MIDPIYVSVSAQVALENRLKTISENVANAATIGYRGSQIHFEQVLNEKIGRGTQTVSAGTETISMRSGVILETGGSFDFAISGQGWFGVQRGNAVALTRDGRFTINNTGQLLTLNGEHVLDAGGAPVEIPGDPSSISVGSDGIIYRDGAPVSGIGVFEVNTSSQLQRVQGNAFVSDQVPVPLLTPGNFEVLRGHLEMSNIDPITEIVQLITVQRTFEQSAALMKTTSDTVDAVIRSLSP